MEDEEGNVTTEFSSTQRLKLGGTGATDGSYRSIAITVTGACTITVYMMSSSSTATRTAALYEAITGEDGNTTLTSVETADVDGSSLNKVTFTISGEGTYYINSTGSGINVYGLVITYAEDGTAE